MIGYDLNIIERGIRGIFAREFMTRQRKAKYPAFCTVVDSDKQTERYNAISTLPQLQEMTDERVLAGFSEYSYDIENKVYATGIKVPRRIFEFDQTGQLRTLVQSLGARVANFPDSLVWAMLATCETATGYDDVAFASAAHDLGDGVSQSNYMTGNLTNTLIASATSANRDNAIAAIQNDFRLAKAMLLELNDDRGEPWHDDAEPESLIIICHPRAEFFIRTALEASIILDTGNVLVKSVGRILTTNRTNIFKVSGTLYYGTWYLFKVDTPIKPMIFQRFGAKTDFPDTIPEADQAPLQALNSVEVQTIMRTGSDISETTFFDDDFLFGARTLYSAGFGMWQNMIRVDGAA